MIYRCEIWAPVMVNSPSLFMVFDTSSVGDPISSAYSCLTKRSFDDLVPSLGMSVVPMVLSTLVLSTQKYNANENWSKRCQSGRTNQVGFLAVEHTDFAPVCYPRQGVQ